MLGSFLAPASSVRFLARDRARVNAWFSTGVDLVVHPWAAIAGRGMPSARRLTVARIPASWLPKPCCAACCGTPEPTPWPNPGSRPRGSTGATRRRTAQARPVTTPPSPNEEDHMAVMTERSAGDTTIRPFTIDIPEAELEDLRARVAATRFPEKEPVDDLSQGVQLATMQALARYWETEYDWGECEERLKALPHFITEIDGLDIHFVHVRSEHEDAMPLLVAHGWPGSVIEQLKIIE